MGTTTLRVVGDSSKNTAEAVGTSQVSEADLTRAEEELRKEARSLVHEIEHKYWDLGRVLYDVFDGVPGGYRGLLKGKGSKTERAELFKKWGYTSFGEYVEKEVGIRKRTAENLRYAYYWFAIAQNIPEEVISRLISIGRSKVYLLAGTADINSITLWIDKANELTFEELKKSINAARAVSAAKPNDPSEPSQADPEATGVPDLQSKSLPKPEEMSTFQAGLFEGQKKTCDAAFERAMGISNSEKKGHNLELICQDFLQNNDFDDPKKDVDKYIAKMERRLGLLMIAIDPQTGKPVHGQDLLWRLIEESQKGDEE
jgi:hypothetical protein